MADWYPNALRVPGNDGGSFTSGPPKGLLHTTEGSTNDGALGAYRANNSWPHFTISWEPPRTVVWQHIPISRAARALKNKSGGVQTNREHVIQIEIVGFATDPRPYHGRFLEGLRGLMRWIETNAGVPRSCGVDFKAYPASYGLKNGVRLSGPAWDVYSGWCGHQHAPENDHGDPGAIPIGLLLDQGDDDMPLSAKALQRLEHLLADDDRHHRFNVLLDKVDELAQFTDDYPKVFDAIARGFDPSQHASVYQLCASIWEILRAGADTPGAGVTPGRLAAALRQAAAQLEA